MRIKGPFVTLLGGLLVAGVLLGLSLAATKTNSNPSTTNAADNAAAVAPSTAAAAPSTPAPSESAKAEEPAVLLTFAGKVNGGAATVAIAVKGGKAIAYLCNGRNLEAWYQGEAKDGKLTLTGANQASLTGAYDATAAEGSVTTAGKTYTFRVQMVQPPNGLYRLVSRVAGNLEVGGWITVNGETTGMVTTNGVSAPGGEIDPATGKVVVNGVEKQAGRADPTAPNG
jgi:serine/threonine-protein kinase